MSDLYQPEPVTEDVHSEMMRHREEEFADHLQAMAERDREHRTDWKPAPRVKRSNMPRPDRLWRQRVLERDQGCCLHRNPAECREGWQAHHVVTQQTLRKFHPEALWDVRAGMGVCGLAHRQHHSRVRPIDYEEIPTVVVEYLSGLGFAVWLERHYPASGATLSDGQA